VPLAPKAERAVALEVFMKKVFGSLPFRLLFGIAIGIVCGLFFGEGAMKVIVTLKYIMG
jgi:Na+/H+-dicarboxylate symporter